MTEEQKIAMIRLMLGDEVIDLTDDTLSAFLSRAEQFILNTVFPYDEEATLPDRYVQKQIELAVYDISKIGMEGQTGHSENGATRNYESGSYPDSMIEDLVPFVGGIDLT